MLLRCEMQNNRSLTFDDIRAAFGLIPSGPKSGGNSERNRKDFRSAKKGF